MKNHLTFVNLLLKLWPHSLYCILILAYAFPVSSQITIEGELKAWHKVTLNMEGPSSSETASPNPFADYRLEATFTKGSQTYTVPGYFAACGNAAETSCTSGNIWRIHFAPDSPGNWNYTISFKQGTNVAITSGGSPISGLDGYTGSFTVSATDKTGVDHRAKGRLRYVGEHYLQFVETGEYFFKIGPDAPENTLAYEDFDDTPNHGNRRKSWSPHQMDYNASEADAFTW